MSSNRRRAANRRNAIHSTGPRSAQGKARASRNALKHGLAARIAYDSKQGEAVERLAEAIAAEYSDHAELGLVRAVAEADLDLRRVRTHRAALLDTAAVMEKLETASRNLDKASDDSVPPQSYITAMMKTLDQLATLERYERRAFSRRNRLLRELLGRVRINPAL